MNSADLKLTQDAIIYRKKQQPAQSDTILLQNRLKMSTEWAEVVASGPDSILREGDEILISSRPASFKVDCENETVYNLDDRAVICFKRDNVIKTTKGTILLEVVEKEEKFSAGGILLSTVKPVDELVWMTVFAAGPQSGVEAGDKVLVKEATNAYRIEIENKIYRNAGHEEIVCYTSK